MELLEKALEISQEKKFKVEFYLINNIGIEILQKSKIITYLELGLYLMNNEIKIVKIIQD